MKSESGVCVGFVPLPLVVRFSLSFLAWVYMASSGWFLVEAKSEALSFQFVMVRGVSVLQVYGRCRGLV
jgi:hypothetical protein